MNKTPETVVFYNARLIDADMDQSGCVLVKDGIIDTVCHGRCEDLDSVKKLFDAEDYIDCEKKVLMPAFIDMHVHFRYPGQTQKEDLDSGLQAAAAAGVGTVVLMPNTNPVVSTASMAFEIMDEARKRKMSNVFQTVSLTKDFAGSDTGGLDDCNCKQIPVVSEDGHDVASTSVMLEAMEKAGRKNIITACHCEDTFIAQTARPYRLHALELMKANGIPAGKINVEVPGVSKQVNDEIDASFSKANELLALAEDAATERNIEIAKHAPCHIHVCHCSTKNSIDAVRRAKSLISEGKTKKGFNCSVEVTPHHISMTGDVYPYTRALVNPPLRGEEDRRALIEAIKDGTVDVISTDHAPHTLEDKAAGSPGFTGIELSYAVCNDVLVKQEGLSQKRLSALMAGNPAKLLSLKKGLLRPGYDADLVITDPDEVWVVDCSVFKSKGKSSPADGKTLTGRVKKTFVSGRCIYNSK